MVEKEVDLEAVAAGACCTCSPRAALFTCSAARNAARSSAHTSPSASPEHRTVAARGVSYSKASSPKPSPGRHVPTGVVPTWPRVGGVGWVSSGLERGWGVTQSPHLVEVDVEGSAEHDVEVSAVGFALVDQRLAAADLLALHVVHEDVDLLLVHGAEERVGRQRRLWDEGAPQPPKEFARRIARRRIARRRIARRRIARSPAGGRGAATPRRRRA